MRLELLTCAVVLAAALVSGCLGGPVSQSVECTRYVACIRALDAAQGLTTNLVRFEADGACWGNGEISQLCTTGCSRALERMRDRTAGLPQECTP
jgi:hypothetical protein